MDDASKRPSAPSRETLLTPDEVAEILRVGKDWVYRRARVGDLPRRKVGRYVRFSRDEVYEWLESLPEGDLNE